MGRYKIICDILKNARIRANKTVRGVAEDTGLSACSISRFENGMNNNAYLLLHYMAWYCCPDDIYDIIKSVMEGDL